MNCAETFKNISNIICHYQDNEFVLKNLMSSWRAIDMDENATTKTDVHLSHRELQVLKLLTNGLNNKDIAQHLGVTRETVKSHMKRILSKMGVSGRTEAAVIALKTGLVERLS